MRKGNEIPKVKSTDNLRKAILEISDKGIGSTLVVEDNKLLGIFTDGDLRRMFEAESFNSQKTINEVMSKNPKTVSSDEMAISALEEMERFEITSLAVVDGKNNVEGIITMHDLVKLGLR